MRKLIVLVGAAIAGLVLVVQVGVASAAATNTVQIIGRESFVPNAIILATFQYAPGLTIVLHSGDSVTWRNTTGEPHTVSVVAQSQLPRTVQEVFSCPVCGAIFQAHGASPDGGVAHPVVNAGRPGLDTPFESPTDLTGDSLVIPPNGSVTATVSAPGGASLHYMCAIHPWMQGELRVLNLPSLP